MIPPQQTIELILTRAFPALELAITEPTVATAEMVAAVKGSPGQKGDPGDPNLIELGVDPALIFENALV